MARTSPVGFTCPVTLPTRSLAVLAALMTLLTACAPAVPSGSAPATATSSGAAPTPPTSTPATTEPSASPSPSAAPVDCRKLKCVALTFDDGPGPQTSKLLDTLVKERVPAAFFLVGRMLRQHPDVARRIARTPGMTIANHTVTHPMLTRIAPSKARDEIVGNTTLIRRITGVRPSYFRPPYGLHNRATDAVAKGQGQAVILWSAGALDWQYDTPAKIVEVTLPQIAPGAIVLAHDIHPWTIKAVPTLIQRLRAKGYTLVSLDDILGPTKPGASYARGRR